MGYNGPCRVIAERRLSLVVSGMKNSAGTKAPTVSSLTSSDLFSSSNSSAWTTSRVEVAFGSWGMGERCRIRDRDKYEFTRPKAYVVLIFDVS